MTTPSNQQPEATPETDSIFLNMATRLKWTKLGKISPGNTITLDLAQGMVSEIERQRNESRRLVSKSRELLQKTLRHASQHLPVDVYEDIQWLLQDLNVNNPNLVPIPSGIEKQICEEITKRQQMGIQKYGTTLADNKLTHKERLQHAKEEALDLAMYLQKEINEIDAGGGK